MVISPAQNLSYLAGTAEPHLQRIIRQYVSTGYAVYDIGANMGYVSLSLARQVGPAGTVVAFEPLPQNLALLRANIELNHLGNIKLMDKAASDRNGTAILRVADAPSMASLVWHKDDPNATQSTIETVAIDDLVDNRLLPLPRFVKIDVEGSEGQVLQGMARTLARALPVIFVEASDCGRVSSWALLRGLGYTCRRAVEQTEVRMFEEYRHADFLWLPPARPSRFPASQNLPY
jgi:FkbM family methyltransferase